MTIQKSVIILHNTENHYDVIGEPFRADSWYGHVDGLHTVSVTYSNFHGNFHIQGSLSTDPTDESSWFDIDINSANHLIPYIEFNGESGINAFTFVGNFTFIRANMTRSDRTDLDPSSLSDNLASVNQGSINNAIMAM